MADSEGRRSPAMRADTGSRLRSLYEPQGGVGGIFSSKVADYIASRPDYPAQLFETLTLHCGLERGSVVADLGAGTGLLTRGFLQRGCHVVAVEPNAPMRSACDQGLGHIEGYRSVAGSAEAMPLEDASIDLVAAAQAFHWFDAERSRAECLRVLRGRGQVALIWNDRLPADPLHVRLDEVLAGFGGEKRAALLAHEERGDVAGFFRAAAPVEFTWPHEHFLDRAGLLSLVFSRSYMPDRHGAAGRQVCGRLGEIFDAFAVDGRLCVRYTTVAIVGRPA